MPSRFENLKKQMLQRWEVLENRIYESDTFNTFKEKFQSLSPGRQKTFKYLSVVLSLFILFSIPLLYFYSSSENLRDFKEKENLSLKLLKKKADTSSLLNQRSSIWVKSNIKTIVEKYQKEEYSIVEKGVSATKNPLIKPHEMEVSVKHLNIKQIVLLGENLNSLGSIRIHKLKIKESSLYKNHYDTHFSVLFFPPSNIKPLRKNPPLPLPPKKRTLPKGS